MIRAFAAVLVILAILVAVRRRRNSWGPWAEDWNDPAMDVYDARVDRGKAQLDAGELIEFDVPWARANQSRTVVKEPSFAWSATGEGMDWA